MAQSSANELHWKAYLLGPITGIPKLIRGVRREDRTEAFHGAQATAWGCIFLLGLFLLGFVLRMALPEMGIEENTKSLYVSVAMWLCYYLWIGGGLWLYFFCMITAKGGGWNVFGFLTWCALKLENFVAVLFGR